MCTYKLLHCLCPCLLALQLPVNQGNSVEPVVELCHLHACVHTCARASLCTRLIRRNPEMKQMLHNTTWGQTLHRESLSQSKKFLKPAAGFVQIFAPNKKLLMWIQGQALSRMKMSKKSCATLSSNNILMGVSSSKGQEGSLSSLMSLLIIWMICHNHHSHQILA